MKSGLRCPEKLSTYIERAFQKCMSPQDRQFMESVLQKICQAHKQNNTLFTRDWDSAALPTLPREGK
jgi:DNA topoisomerase IA